MGKAPSKVRFSLCFAKCSLILDENWKVWKKKSVMLITLKYHLILRKKKMTFPGYWRQRHLWIRLFYQLGQDIYQLQNTDLASNLLILSLVLGLYEGAESAVWSSLNFSSFCCPLPSPSPILVGCSLLFLKPIFWGEDESTSQLMRFLLQPTKRVTFKIPTIVDCNRVVFFFFSLIFTNELVWDSNGDQTGHLKSEEYCFYWFLYSLFQIH